MESISAPHPFRTRSEPDRLLAALAPWHGRRLNTAAIGRRLGVSRPTVVARLKVLEAESLIRLLPFFGGGRRPLLYLRVGCGRKGSGDFRSFCIESIVTRLQALLPESRCYWWEIGRVRRIDLLVETPLGERIGFCFCVRWSPCNRDWWPLRIAQRQGLIHRGLLLHHGDRASMIARAVFALPAGSFLLEAKEWLLWRRTVGEARETFRRINDEILRRRWGSRDLGWKSREQLRSA